MVVLTCSLSSSQGQAISNTGSSTNVPTTTTQIHSNESKNENLDDVGDEDEDEDESLAESKTPTKTRKLLASTADASPRLIPSSKMPDWLDFFPTSTPISAYFPEGAEAEVALSAQTAFPDHRNSAAPSLPHILSFSLGLVLLVINVK
ncbi:hypothetical protein K7432_013115 [Basidiobolus ranarum]|uniref:Uncharacterized protein n=1 Tax=Basidiobolus ranarum TaxID=34480 RepID=A0ABR2VS72_9FUNG